MGNVIWEIEAEVGDDIRLNQVPLKIVVRNQTDQKIRILALAPNIPEQAQLEEKSNEFKVEAKEQFDDLRGELSLIVACVLLQQKAHRENVVKTVLNTYVEALEKIPFLRRKIIASFFEFKSEIEKLSKNLSRLAYSIDSEKDAQWAYKKWIEPLKEDHPDRQLYEAKLQQLLDLANDIDGDPSSYIAQIEPGSFYSRTYVLKFGRRKLSTKIYNISFDCKHTDEKNQECRMNVSKSVSITPSPLILTLFAALSSILGSALKYCMIHASSGEEITLFFTGLLQYTGTASISSAIIAILLFNIYEFTDLGKKLRFGISWRSALTFGILSGLFGDRIIDSLKVLILGNP